MQIGADPKNLAALMAIKLQIMQNDSKGKRPAKPMPPGEIRRGGMILRKATHQGRVRQGV